MTNVSVSSLLLVYSSTDLKKDNDNAELFSNLTNGCYISFIRLMLDTTHSIYKIIRIGNSSISVQSLVCDVMKNGEISMHECNIYHVDKNKVVDFFLGNVGNQIFIYDFKHILRSKKLKKLFI